MEGSSALRSTRCSESSTPSVRSARTRKPSSRLRAERCAPNSKSSRRRIRAAARRRRAHRDRMGRAAHSRRRSLLRRFRAAQVALARRRHAARTSRRVARRTTRGLPVMRCAASPRSRGAGHELRASGMRRARRDRGRRAGVAFRSLMRNRADRASTSTESTSAESDVDALHEILIRLEIFAGVESPGEDRDRRRELQVERLSARMRGASATTPHEELADLLTRWTDTALRVACARRAPASRPRCGDRDVAVTNPSRWRDAAGDRALTDILSRPCGTRTAAIRCPTGRHERSACALLKR